MRIPGAVALYKRALPLIFPGLTIGDDLSNRTSVVSASTSWTIWYDPVTGKNRRSSAADGLLWAANQQRDCLTVLATHKVAKVVFDEAMTATGVSFASNNGSSPSPNLFNVYASKGVILSAGSLASGPILERSGIGRADILSAAGVKQMVDLPGVGSNLNASSCSPISKHGTPLSEWVNTYTPNSAQDQPGTSSSALVSEAYQNDTSIIDGRNLFAPEISLVNVDEIWGASEFSGREQLYAISHTNLLPGASVYVNDLTSSKSLQSRAQALVDASAAVNIDGAQAILSTAIDLIATSRCKAISHHLPISKS